MKLDIIDLNVDSTLSVVIPQVVVRTEFPETWMWENLNGIRFV